MGGAAGTGEGEVEVVDESWGAIVVIGGGSGGGISPGEGDANGVCAVPAEGMGAGGGGGIEEVFDDEGIAAAVGVGFDNLGGGEGVHETPAVEVVGAGGAEVVRGVKEEGFDGAGAHGLAGEALIVVVEEEGGGAHGIWRGHAGAAGDGGGGVAGIAGGGQAGAVGDEVGFDAAVVGGAAGGEAGEGAIGEEALASADGIVDGADGHDVFGGFATVHGVVLKFVGAVSGGVTRRVVGAGGAIETLIPCGTWGWGATCAHVAVGEEGEVVGEVVGETIEGDGRGVVAAEAEIDVVGGVGIVTVGAEPGDAVVEPTAAGAVGVVGELNFSGFV